MNRERRMVSEVLRRTARVVADLADEHDLDDDALHALAGNLEDIARESLGMPRLSAILSGRDALEQLIDELEQTEND